MGALDDYRRIFTSVTPATDARGAPRVRDLAALADETRAFVPSRDEDARGLRGVEVARGTAVATDGHRAIFLPTSAPEGFYRPARGRLALAERPAARPDCWRIRAAAPGGPGMPALTEPLAFVAALARAAASLRPETTPLVVIEGAYHSASGPTYLAPALAVEDGRRLPDRYLARFESQAWVLAQVHEGPLALNARYVGEALAIAPPEIRVDFGRGPNGLARFTYPDGAEILIAPTVCR